MRTMAAIAVGLAGIVLVLASVALWLRRSREALRNRREEAEEALVAATRRAEDDRHLHEMVLATMRDGVLLVGPGDEIAFANAALETHLGSVPSSLTGLLPLVLRTAVEESRLLGEPSSVLFETGAPSRWLRAAITPAPDDHALLIIRDVTQQRRLEAVRSDFVENASHELKTPASTIQATAETLRRAAREDPDAVPRFVAQLEREAMRLSRLVADLLDLSRLESGGFLDEVVSLTQVAREECRRLRPAADRAGVALAFRASGERRMMGSSRDLSLLARNLIDNAIRYSREGDEVLVEVNADDGEIVLRVRDTGMGIPTRDLSRVFERFYRVDRARSRETGGTGLGLAIVKHVVENHRGRTSVESELGRGSTFEAIFPSDPRT